MLGVEGLLCFRGSPDARDFLSSFLFFISKNERKDTKVFEVNFNLKKKRLMGKEILISGFFFVL